MDKKYYTVIGRLDGAEDVLRHVKAEDPREAIARAEQEERDEARLRREADSADRPYYVMAIFEGKLEACFPCEVRPYLTKE